MRIFSFFLLSLFSLETYAVSFPDTTYSFYGASIETLASEGIISGFSDGTFGPDRTITRAEFLKILMKVKGVDLASASKESCFRDVRTTLWYHPYICEAVKLGVVRGFADGSFKPDNPVTTLEALAIGLRLYGLAPTDGEPWYTRYQALANEKNILRTSDYNLSTPISRGKASEYILRLREYDKTKAPPSSKSLGCSTPRTLGANNTIEIAGKTRSYILSIPAGYTSTNSYRLIIANHGRTNSNSMAQDYMGLEGGSRWNAANNTDTIIAYPAALKSGSSFSWSSDENVTFVDAIIHEVSSAYCIDRDSVFVVGHSLGAWFTSKLACVRGDVWRGMAIVGGGGYTTPCKSSPTAALIYQNANDTLSSPSFARTVEKTMKSVNTCNNQTESVQIGSLTCQKWKDCTSGNPVIWCEGYSTLGGDPHSWPTGGGGVILEFFRGL